MPSLIDSFSLIWTLMLAAIVKLATDLAQRFDARIIGLSAGDVPLPVATAEGMVFDGELLQVERQQIEKRLGEVRLEFEQPVGAVVATDGARLSITRLVFCSSPRVQPTLW